MNLQKIRIKLSPSYTKKYCDKDKSSPLFLRFVGYQIFWAFCSICEQKKSQIKHNHKGGQKTTQLIILTISLFNRKIKSRLFFGITGAKKYPKLNKIFIKKL